jgi:hypothetical protein
MNIDHDLVVLRSKEKMIYINRNFSNRPGCVFTFLGTIFILVAVVLLAIAGNELLQEQGYQSGQCTITARQLLHENSTSTSTYINGTKKTTSTDAYAPYFEYTVRTAGGRSYTASGYDGSNTYTSDRAGQQAIVDQYNIGQSYQCWYNPANPTQAILVRHPDWLFFLIGGVFLLLGGLFAIVGILALLGLFRPGGRSWRYSWR